MREAILPRGRVVLNDRPRRTGGKFGLLSARRMSTWAVLAIAGLAAVGVPMNALFFQDGAHPAPIFAGRAPPKPVEAARVEPESAAPAKTDSIPMRAPAIAKRGDLAADELAALAAEPAARAPRVGPKPEAAKAAAKPAAAKAATDKAAARTAAKPAAKPAAPSKPDASKTDPARAVVAKPATKSASAAAPRPPVKPAAKAQAQSDPKTQSDAKTDAAAHFQRSSVSDLIGHLIGAAAR